MEETALAQVLEKTQSIGKEIIRSHYPDESDYFDVVWASMRERISDLKEMDLEQWLLVEHQIKLSKDLEFTDVSEILSLNSPKILFIISAVLVKIMENYKFSTNTESKELLSIIEKYGNKFKASPPLIRHLKDKLPSLIDLRDLAECQIMQRVKRKTKYSYAFESEANLLLDKYKTDKGIDLILDKRSNNLYIKGKFVRKLEKVSLRFIACILESEKDVCPYRTIAYEVWNEEELDDTCQMKRFKDKLFHQIKEFLGMAECLKNAVEIEEGEGIRIGEGLRNYVIISLKQ
jgi:hypothetical protein